MRPIIIVILLIAAGFTAPAAEVVVNTTLDAADGDTACVACLVAGPGADEVISLREALLAANNDPGATEIRFALEAGAVVQVLSPLPALAKTDGGIDLDGGGAVTLDGSQAPEGTDGLLVTGADHVVAGLTIIRFSGAGVRIAGAAAQRNWVRGCMIGTDGTMRKGNLGAGVQVEGGAAKTLIGGTSPSDRNVLSANFAGIQMADGTSDTRIVGNWIGTTADGTQSLENVVYYVDGKSEMYGGTGIWIREATDVQVGGAAPGEGNVISSYQAAALVFTDSSGLVIQGNAQLRLPQTGEAILPQSIAGDGMRTARVRDVQVGGTEPGAGNRFEGFTESTGIRFSNSERVTIQGNYVGSAGEPYLPLYGGISVDLCRNVLIGGETPGAGNHIFGFEVGVFNRFIKRDAAITVLGNEIVNCTRRSYDGYSWEVTTPTVTCQYPLRGRAPACARVDLYIGDLLTTQQHVGTVYSNACGRYTSDIDLSAYAGQYLEVMATTAFGATSRPSTRHRVRAPEEAGTCSVPADCALACPPDIARADINADGAIDLQELLRAIQLYNAGGYQCDAGGEDGFGLGPGDTACAPHTSDFAPMDWQIDISELLRVIQFFNSPGYGRCPTGEDGYCPLGV